MCVGTACGRERARGPYQSITSGCVSGDEMGRERETERVRQAALMRCGGIERERGGVQTNSGWYGLCLSQSFRTLIYLPLRSPLQRPSASLPPFLILFPLSLPPSPLLALSVFLSHHLCFLPVVFFWIHRPIFCCAFYFVLFNRTCGTKTGVLWPLLCLVLVYSFIWYCVFLIIDKINF